MSYKINKTDGSLLVDLIDGVIDNNTTDITLVGKNYTGFGEIINENFVKMLENFSSGDAPSTPLTGQLWYDSNTGRLNVYDGSQFKIAGGPLVAASQPDMDEGDLWINNFTKQLWFWDGNDVQLAGPNYTAQQGRTGFFTEEILDEQGRYRVVSKMYIAGQLVGIYSNLEFNAVNSTGLPSLTVQKGFNPVNPDEFLYLGTASYSRGLTKQNGEVVNADQFLPADRDAAMTGSLTISNNGGIRLGEGGDASFIIDNTNTVLQNNLSDKNFIIKIKSSANGGVLTDAIHVDSANLRVGIFTPTPGYTMDVTGDLRVTGNLLVEGTTTNVDTTILRVADKNIELGITDDSTMLTEAQADGAGFIIKVQGNDKTFQYAQTTASFDSSENMQLAVDKKYMIDGEIVVEKTQLGSSITSAPGITSLGTLSALTVDELSFNDGTITASNTLDIITTDNEIAVNSSKITGLAAPTADTDAATKKYADDVKANETLAFSLDITGLSNSQIAKVINYTYPASDKNVGCIAMIHTTSLTGASVTGIQITVTTFPDTSGVLTQNLIPVDSNGTQNESTVNDVAFSNPASGTVNVTISRGLKRFFVANDGSGNYWKFDTDVAQDLVTPYP
jgi:hypothetical protein